MWYCCDVVVVCHNTVRSMVGLIPLFASMVLKKDTLDKLPGFRDRMIWLLRHRPDLATQVASSQQPAALTVGIIHVHTKAWMPH